MDGAMQRHSPRMEEGLWKSPEDIICREQGESMRTPHLSGWPSQARSLEDSEGSSKQDSGYCSLTPRSAESLVGIFDQKCRLCNKYSNQSYAQSTPQCVMCSCGNNFYESQTSNLEYLQTISENKMSSARPYFSQYRRSVDLGDDIDTSLYPEEMEVEEQVSGETNHSTLGLLETGEENSIDFIDGAIYHLSSDKSKDTDQVNIQEISDGNVQDNKLVTEEFFSPKSESFTCDVFKPRIINETTPSKNNRNVNFQSVAKTVTTLNRVIRVFSLNGIERLDFIYQLSVKINCTHIVSKVLSFLSEKDLDSVRLVSKLWNEAVHNDCASYKRWKMYRTTMHMMKENFTSPSKAGSSMGRQRPVIFNTINNITNQLSPVRSDSPRQISPPVTPESARFRSFQKAALLLKKGERLLQCPKCFFPSFDRGSPTVQCSRSGCRHRFCVWCRNTVTHSVRHVCPPLYTPRIRRLGNKLPNIGSKDCKRNLRRL